MKTGAYFFLIFILCLSCKKDVVTSSAKNDGVDSLYLGNTVGNYTIFNVTHIVHDEEVDVHDTSYFLYKISIGDTVVENDHSFANKYFRYNWNSILGQWSTLDVWKIKKKDKYGILTEENQSIIKLFFPIVEDFSWNANRFNNQDSLYYVYKNVHKKVKIDDLVFDSTVTIEQENYFTLVDLKRKKEVYAKNVGLVSKYYKDLRIKNFDSTRVQKGEEWYFTVKSFGKE